MAHSGLIGHLSVFLSVPVARNQGMKKLWHAWERHKIFLSAKSLLALKCCTALKEDAVANKNLFIKQLSSLKKTNKNTSL